MCAAVAGGIVLMVNETLSRAVQRRCRYNLCRATMPLYNF
jgi:hypothetical protein